MNYVKAIATFVMLGLCVWLCAFEQQEIEKVYAKTIEYADTALAYANKEDYKKTQESCARLNEFWDGEYKYLSSMLNHSLTQDADIEINSLGDTKEKEFEEIKENLIEIKSRAEMIKKSAEINFGNIF